jgi:hypothetical protein
MADNEGAQGADIIPVKTGASASGMAPWRQWHNRRILACKMGMIEARLRTSDLVVCRL